MEGDNAPAGVASTAVTGAAVVVATARAGLRRAAPERLRPFLRLPDDVAAGDDGGGEEDMVDVLLTRKKMKRIAGVWQSNRYCPEQGNNIYYFNQLYLHCSNNARIQQIH
jgi:hypothetical protein